jgi:hypothetical protein
VKKDLLYSRVARTIEDYFVSLEKLFLES